MKNYGQAIPTENPQIHNINILFRRESTENDLQATVAVVEAAAVTVVAVEVEVEDDGAVVLADVDAAEVQVGVDVAEVQVGAAEVEVQAAGVVIASDAGGHLNCMCIIMVGMIEKICCEDCVIPVSSIKLTY